MSRYLLVAINDLDGAKCLKLLHVQLCSFPRLHPGSLAGRPIFCLPVSQRCQPNVDPALFSPAWQLPRHQQHGLSWWSVYLGRWNEGDYSQLFHTVRSILKSGCSFRVSNIRTACTLLSSTQKGNIFLCDYKRLDGLRANIINGKQQYMMAPLVLLHKTPENKLMPIAIQVRLMLQYITQVEIVGLKKGNKRPVRI